MLGQSQSLPDVRALTGSESGVELSGARRNQRRVTRSAYACFEKWTNYPNRGRRRTLSAVGGEQGSAPRATGCSLGTQSTAVPGFETGCRARGIAAARSSPWRARGTIVVLSARQRGRAATLRAKSRAWDGVLQSTPVDDGPIASEVLTTQRRGRVWGKGTGRILRINKREQRRDRWGV